MMLRWAMVGGGGGKIGPAHLEAAHRSGSFALVAAAPSSRPEVAAAMDWGCPTTADWRELLTAGLDAVSIVTPNHLHMDMAKAFDAAGVAVICDKPLGRTLGEVEGWSPSRPFIVTYNYTAYPAVRRARQLVADGALGEVRLVRVGWAQDVMMGATAEAGWRGDVARSGPGGTLADLGTHCFHIAEFLTGRRITALAAEVEDFGAPTPRQAAMLCRFEGGLRGDLWFSQVTPGAAKGLEVLVAGTKASLRWRLAAPDDVQMLAVGELADAPPALPADLWRDGFIDAFAALYADAARTIRGEESLAPGYADGVRGMRFIDAALRSGGDWVGL